MNIYDVGDRVRITATFTNAAGAAADPTTVRASYRTDQGAVTTLISPNASLVQSATGTWYVDIDVTTAGLWDYRFAGTGAVVAAAEGQFNVRQSNF